MALIFRDFYIHLYEVIIMFNKIKNFFDNDIVLLVLLVLMFVLVGFLSGITGEAFHV